MSAQMVRRSLIALCFALALTSCKRGRGASEVDEATQRREAVNQRLMGSWVLVTFQPSETLEPMLASLLAAQFGALTVQFDGRMMQAQGIGVTTTRRYEIRDAQFERFKLVSYDDKGIAYDTWAEFKSPDEIWFDSRTPPWRGVGTLRRNR